MARRDALLRLNKALFARRTELRKRLGMELTDLSRASYNTTGDAADIAFGSTGEEVSSQLVEMEAKELQQIEHALLKLRQGTYGRCEGCNVTIPVMRLNALPYSTLCITCQREMETDSSWWGRHTEASWERVSDSDHSMEDRRISIADLEMGFSK